jgi:hypothetical protein
MRASHLADLIESYAVNEKRITKADLTDMLADANIADSAPPRFVSLASDYDPEFAAGSLAERAFAVLDERRALLKDRYPFERFRSGIRLRNQKASVYRLLLGMTLVHAHDPEHALCRPIQKHMELLAKRYLESRNLRAFELARNENATGNFRERIVAILESADRPAAPREIIDIKANDGGTDYIGLFDIGTRRSSVLSVAAQVSCGHPKNWGEKAAQPKVKKWQSLLSSQVRPVPLLAVPHHAESDWLSQIEQGCEGLLVDRLELTRVLKVEAVDQKLLDEVGYCLCEFA